MLRSFNGDVEIINEYGPTEATAGCMIHRFNPDEDTKAFVPVGTPAANAQIYVLDDDLEPVAENVLGEIYIAGDCMARGYHKRPHSQLKNVLHRRACSLAAAGNH